MIMNWIMNWRDKPLKEKLEILEAHRLIYLDALNYKPVHGEEPNRQKIIEQWEMKDCIEYKKLKEELRNNKLNEDF